MAFGVLKNTIDINTIVGSGNCPLRMTAAAGNEAAGQRNTQFGVCYSSFFALPRQNGEIMFSFLVRFVQ